MSSAPPAAGTWRLRRRLGRSAFAFACVILVAATVLAVAAVNFARTGNEVIYRLQPAQAASQRMLSDLVNQETGVRGYLLTGSDAALRPYLAFRAAQRVDTERARSLSGSYPEVQERIDRFDAAAAAWRRKVAEPAISSVRAGLRQPGADAVSGGRALVDRIRHRGAALTATVASRVAQTRSARSRDGVLVGGALGIGVLLIAIAGFGLWRGLHRWVLGPVDALALQARSVAAGDVTAAITPSGPAELRDLGLDIERMRAQIVAELARAEEISADLAGKAADLQRSNGDLQQFAYVASHDLSEPLRKVANFCQLLERQYAPELDDRARQYIDFAVDGAKRMQALIGDLLALSRVGRSTDDFSPVDLDAVLDRALGTLSEQISASEAQIERPADLPVVKGDASLLASLLENLVGNAVKYRRDDVAPVIALATSFDVTQGEWTFTVSDNGIGIDPQYAERIFAVFQRLHLRDQYGGTGIGLALCRRIVEFHGGHIWLDSVQSASGSTFVFTLPEGATHAEND